MIDTWDWKLRSVSKSETRVVLPNLLSLQKDIAFYCTLTEPILILACLAFQIAISNIRRRKVFEHVDWAELTPRRYVCDRSFDLQLPAARY